MKLKYFKKKAESFYYEAGGCDSKFERYWTWINSCSPLMLTCSTTLHNKNVLQTDGSFSWKLWKRLTTHDGVSHLKGVFQF